MKNSPIIKHYWGIGLENETYLQFEESLVVSGQFIREKMGHERYSLNYLKCYKEGCLEKVLARAFNESQNYLVSQMMNSHSLEKLDVHFQHKTLQSPPPLLDNPEYSGKSILELFLEKQPHQIKSMLTQKNNPMGSIIFDGDTIEFVTKYYENRTIQESFNELKASKKLFLEKLNDAKILSGNLTYPDYNMGINMFMSNQKNLVLFNNGTFHFHITLPTLTEDSRIVDYAAFDIAHHKAIYLLQWFEPLFIATLGSPDIMSVISEKFEMAEKFAGGSMRNAMSRYTGVGTYHKSMPKGKVLTYPVNQFRKLLTFKKDENIWWRDRIESELSYELLSDVGLDFNREKLYQSGYEFRSFDEFPTDYLPEVLHAIVLISEHAQHIDEVTWASNNIVWNNLVFKTLTQGFKSEMSGEEKNEIMNVFQIPMKKRDLINNSDRLDEFFFQILHLLHETHNESSEYLKSFLYEKSEEAPRWNNFNQHQAEQHSKQLEEIQ